jgi:hypothetical protein
LSSNAWVRVTADRYGFGLRLRDDGTIDGVHDFDLVTDGVLAAVEVVTLAEPRAVANLREFDKRPSGLITAAHTADADPAG